MDCLRAGIPQKDPCELGITQYSARAPELPAPLVDYTKYGLAKLQLIKYTYELNKKPVCFRSKSETGKVVLCTEHGVISP